MPLFEVPGWSVPSTAPSQSSQKRKRPSNDAGKILSAEMNLDKLMHKLRGDKGEKGADDETPRAAKKRKRSATDATLNDDEEPKPRPPPSAKGKGKEGKGVSDWGARKKEEKLTPSIISGPKRMKGKKEREMDAKRKSERASHPETSTATLVTTASSPSSLPLSRFTFKATPSPDKSGLTALQKGMKRSLDGARFRWINEALYKADSAKSHQMMREDPKVYEEYHTGFRHQVQSWPTNPVSHYISLLSIYPAKTVIADLGCGDAALARALTPKDMIVLSFDLVSDGVWVIEADTCIKVPLPGSEGTEGEKGTSDGEGHIVDVVVCALSLMGTNWPTCVREAWRILKSDGELKIAEVASRFTNIEEFISLIGSIGFKLKSKDDSNSHFTLFEFKKVARKAKNENEWAKLMSKGDLLKPCEYKRR